MRSLLVIKPMKDYNEIKSVAMDHVGVKQVDIPEKR
jgi:hypothetical protein